MSILLVEHEFTLPFGEPGYFSVPFPISDPKAYIVEAKLKITANAAGVKQYVGALLVRDRKLPSAPPAVAYAIVVHRLGPEVEVPQSAGTLVGSFSSHNGEHHWHVFLPKPLPAPPKQPEAAASSRSPKASGSESSPERTPTGPKSSPSRPPGPPAGRAASGPSGATPDAKPSPAGKA